MRIGRSIAFVFVTALSLPVVATADFQIGIPVYATQPNGNRLELRATGDEHYQVTETIEGYTVARDRVVQRHGHCVPAYLRFST